MAVALAELGIRRHPPGSVNPRIVEYNNRTNLVGYDDNQHFGPATEVNHDQFFGQARRNPLHDGDGAGAAGGSERNILYRDRGRRRRPGPGVE